MPDMTRRGFLGSLMVLGGAGLVPLKLDAKEPPPKKINIKVTPNPGWSGDSLKIRAADIAYMDAEGVVCWHRTRFSAIRTGDIFRVVEPDGTIADQGTKNEVCIATEDPVPVPYSEDGQEWTWGVKCDPYSTLTLSPEDVERLKLVGSGVLHPDNMDADGIGVDPFAARWSGKYPKDLSLDDMEAITYKELARIYKGLM